MHKPNANDYIGPLLLALVIGGLAGLGAVMFREMIGLGPNLLWPAGESLVARLTQAPIWLRILIPTAAGLVVGPVVTF